MGKTRTRKKGDLAPSKMVPFKEKNNGETQKPECLYKKKGKIDKAPSSALFSSFM